MTTLQRFAQTETEPLWDYNRTRGWWYVSLHGLLLSTVFVTSFLPTAFGAGSAPGEVGGGALVRLRQAVFALYCPLVLGAFAVHRRKTVTASQWALVVIASLMGVSFAVTAIWHTAYFRTVDVISSIIFPVSVALYAVAMPSIYGRNLRKILVFSIMVSVVCGYILFRKSIGFTNREIGSNFVGMLSVLGGLTTFGSMMARRNSQKVRLISGLFLPVFLVFLVLSVSRTSMIAFGLVILFMFAVGVRGRGKTVILVALMILLAGLWVSGGFDLLIQGIVYKGRTTTAESLTNVETLSGRTEIWARLLAYSEGHVMFGRGATWLYVIAGETTAHSSYLGVFVKYGILAAIGFIVMCAIAGVVAIRSISRSRRTERNAFPGMLVMFYLINSITEDLFNPLPTILLAVFFIATGICIWELRNIPLEGCVEAPGTMHA